MDGWLKIFSDLRNDVVHVAPMGAAQIFHSCQVREWDCGQSVMVPKLHYPVLAGDGTICKMGTGTIDLHDEHALKGALGRYMRFFEASADGLDYAWQTVGRMIALLGKVRSATALRSEMPHITDADLVGVPTFG